VHTSSVYPTEEQVRVAERLTQITPGKLKKSFFTTSGTEADETAIMLAKIYTGQQEIIALRHSYAGRSQGRSRSRTAALARPADPDRGHQTRAVALLLPLPAGARIPRLRHPLRAGHR